MVIVTDDIEKELDKKIKMMYEDLPAGVEFDGERYIIDEDCFEGWE